MPVALAGVRSLVVWSPSLLVGTWSVFVVSWLVLLEDAVCSEQAWAKDCSRPTIALGVDRGSRRDRPSIDLAALVCRQLVEGQVLHLVDVVQVDARQVGLDALVDRDLLAVGCET